MKGLVGCEKLWGDGGVRLTGWLEGEKGKKGKKGKDGKEGNENNCEKRHFILYAFVKNHVSVAGRFDVLEGCDT